MRTLSHQHRPSSGFTMLEVLIAIVVIAFGLLGIAGLQAFALKNNQSATLRSTATVLAGDIIDRAKANPLAADRGLYNKSTAADYGTQVAACLTAAGCGSPELLARHDLYEWARLVATSLPSGSGVVCLDQTPFDGSMSAPACDGAGHQYAVKIWWVDDRTRSALPGQFTTQFEK
jgi:type IV pilus assembly protein PilV